MDNQAYLNQISSQARATKTNKKNIKIMPIIVGAVSLILVILGINLLKNLNTSSVENDCISLKIHINNVQQVITEYQPLVKSSVLRSSSASLNTILSSTTTPLTNYITAQYQYKQNSTHKKIDASEEKLAKALKNDLFTAKINGYLDRSYAHKMAYEIETITNKMKKVTNKIKNKNVTTALTNAYNSLLMLYDEFNNFSEGR